MNSKNIQKDAFINYEANEWWKRNKKVLLNYSTKTDKIISLIQEYQLQPEKALEIGSSAGYRLNGIKGLFPKAELYGIEPSKDAIKYGRKAFPLINLAQGTCDNLTKFEDGKFDLVIIGFVLYVVDRNILFKSISEIDRVLKDNGNLIIIDFYSEKALKNNYKHISEFKAFSFKQRYDEIFTSSQLYQLIDRSCFNHDTSEKDIKTKFQNLYSISLLKKSLLDAYK